MNDLTRYCATGCTWQERRIPVAGNVTLRVVTFIPPERKQAVPVFLIPGLISVMETFRKILVALTGEFVLHYVESREKASSVIEGKADFSVPVFGEDIARVVAAVNPGENKYILMGSSLAATAIIEGVPRFGQKPLGLFLMEPNAVFDYPRWSLPVIRMTPPVFPLIRPLVKWYIRKFRVNTEEDMEMYHISCRALDAADPYKLRNTVLSIYPYTIWDSLANVDIPACVECASKDKFHRHEDIRKIVSAIASCRYADLEVHERTHSAETLQVLKDFLGSLEIS